MRFRHALPLISLGALLAPTATAQVVMTLVGDVDISSTAVATNPEFIGSNPSAVAWDGTNLWIAGYNNDNPANPPQNCAIVKLSNALGGTPTYGTPFGVLLTPGFRGYSGLAIQTPPAGTPRIAAAYDPGASDPNGLQLFDGNTGAQLWAKNIRGGSGVAFDTGFPGGNPSMGTGVAWTTFGSGRRALQNTSTGADIWTTSDGMIWIPPSFSNNFARDMDFDPNTGDIWVRSRNEVIRAHRTADNDTRDASNNQNGEIVADLTDGPFVNQQNLAFIRTRSGSIVIFNDRSSATVGQLSIEDPTQPGAPYVLHVIRPDGTPEAVQWDPTFRDPMGLVYTGGGAYDFSYDSLTNTLAISDFTLRRVFVFSVSVPQWYPYGTGCTGSNGQPLELSVGGTFATGQTVTFDISGAIATVPTQVLVGLNQDDLPLPGTNCDVYIGGILAAFPVQITNASGMASASWTVPSFTPPVAFNLQAVAIDTGLSSPLKLTLSNGVQVDIP